MVCLFLGSITMNKKAIVVENLTAGYRNHPAVHHINTRFSEGCMCAIFGPNGAGKSTLLKTVMGLLRCQTGKVHWEGGLQRNHIAYLPQQSDIDRSQPMSVFELTAMGLWYEIGFFGTVSTQQSERIMAALTRVSMADFADRNIGALSNGQFQRVLFARMLVQNAHFLLLDEPFNAVDAQTTDILLNVLHEENRKGTAVIAVLHDAEQVKTYFPQTLLIAREKVADGDTQQVLCGEYLKQANSLMQIQEQNAWCTEYV